ncbi:MAG TPA: AAA family ATPase [Candidatus Paceibacterota bacterium]
MIIGITGTLGAGKGTVVEYLVQQKGFKHFAVSDTFLAGEAKKRGIEPTRVVRRDIANEFRAKGPTKLMEAVYKMAKGAIEAGENVVLEPQHTAAEVKFIQSIGGIELAVNADLRTRYQRIQKRGSSKDDVTFEQFEAEQIHEMASDNPDQNNLGAAIQAADTVLYNDTTPEELYIQVEAALAGKDVS